MKATGAMKTGFRTFLVLSALLVLCPGVGLAAVYDFSDAAGYTTAQHQDPTWQRLGTGWTSEGSALLPDGDADDGVFWSTDGGATWGHSDILAGQQVTFRFEMYKEMWGKHPFDAIGAWLDLNQDGVFGAGEQILQAAWFFKSLQGTESSYDDTAEVSRYFYTNPFAFAGTGDYWLRARVVCSTDLGLDPLIQTPSQATTQRILGTLDPYTGLYQGEVEDWKVTVTRVPEPASMLLLGLGLGGVAILRRKR